MEFQSVLKIIEKAKEVPSDKCINDEDHNFTFIIHANEKEFSSYYYECKKCKEVVVDKLRKDGKNAIKV